MPLRGSAAPGCGNPLHAAAAVRLPCSLDRSRLRNN
jgi:hypothetical protein